MVNDRTGFTELLGVCVFVIQSCLTLCDPMDYSLPGSFVPGILQARILEWVAISFANAWKWKVKVKSLSRVRLLATPWTAAYQALPSMGFSRQEYWSGVPLPSPGNSHTSPRNPESPKQDKPKVKHPKTHINQISKDQIQRTNIKSSKGKTTNNTQGDSHKDNSWSFNRNSSGQEGMAGHT